jgi:transglutaminase-like putative cysteine protease
VRIVATHTSTYRYDQPLVGGLQELRLTPRPDGRQRIETWDFELDGANEEVTFTDHHGNTVKLVSLEPGAESAVIRCAGVVETADTAGVVDHRGAAPLWIYNRSTSLTAAGARVEELLSRFDDPGDAATDGGLGRMHALSGHVRAAVDYDQGWTDVASSADEVLETGHGVCQDHSHVFLAAARKLGFAARYVSGYLMLPDQVDQDATHAWAEVWIANLGWVGFDVANAVSPDDRYVRLAVGLDYTEAAPISGLRYGEADEELDVALQVQQQ